MCVYIYIYIYFFFFSSSSLCYWSPVLPFSGYLILCYCSASPPPFFSLFLFFSSTLHSLWDPGSRARYQALAPEAGVLSPNCWNNRRCQAPRNINQSETSHRYWYSHINTNTWLYPTACKLHAGNLRRNNNKTGTQSHPLKKTKTKHGKTKKICYRWRSKVNKLQDQINEEEIGNPSEKEFRVMIVKNFQNTENRIDKM